MEVVLVRGGLGMRMRSDARFLPRAMTPVAVRAVPWHDLRRGPSAYGRRVRVIDQLSPATVH
jgi:hypothetical protein